MPTNVVIMVVSIVLISTIGRIYMAKHGLSGRGRAHRDQPDHLIGSAPNLSADNSRLRDEVTMLKDRIAVLERLATEANSTAALDREIEKLR